MTDFVQFKDRVVQNVAQVIVGKDREIVLLLVSFLSGGHVLLEDLPGMGKTMLVRAFSKTLDLPFKRIQFTPDLLPGDITGVSFYNQKEREFEFRKGPLFSNIVLADEINRATPRTQSSLLEAMEERQITVDGNTRPLHMPFMVLATQNPVESFGTFPLPEAQMDRFLMRIQLGYPSMEEEGRIVRSTMKQPLDTLQPVIDQPALLELLSAVRSVQISDEVMDYLLTLVRSTRQREDIDIGVSPRGSIALFRAAQAYAALEGRNYILPEDVKAMAGPTLNHRLVADGHAGVQESTALVEDLLSQVKVPLEDV